MHHHTTPRVAILAAMGLPVILAASGCDDPVAGLLYTKDGMMLSLKGPPVELAEVPPDPIEEPDRLLDVLGGMLGDTASATVPVR